MTVASDEHLRLLPKVELHCHVEGASRASTIADLARRHGVALPADNIAAAVHELGCERIDHGFRLLDDPALTRGIVDRQIPLTMCPTSNLMIANGIEASWAPDDEKRALRERFSREFDDLRTKFGVAPRD